MQETPPISKGLVEYLEKVFSPAHIIAPPSTSPHEIAALVHRENGVQRVIQHLRALYEQQQLEDPLNVHEDPQAA